MSNSKFDIERVGCLYLIGEVCSKRALPPDTLSKPYFAYKVKSFQITGLETE